MNDIDRATEAARLRIIRRIDRMVLEAKCRIDNIEPPPEPDALDEILSAFETIATAFIDAWMPVFNGVVRAIEDVGKFATEYEKENTE